MQNLFFVSPGILKPYAQNPTQTKQRFYKGITIIIILYYPNSCSDDNAKASSVLNMAVICTERATELLRVSTFGRLIVTAYIHSSILYIRANLCRG